MICVRFCSRGRMLCICSVKSSLVLRKMFFQISLKNSQLFGNEVLTTCYRWRRNSWRLSSCQAGHMRVCSRGRQYVCLFFSQAQKIAISLSKKSLHSCIVIWMVSVWLVFAGGEDTGGGVLLVVVFDLDSKSTVLIDLIDSNCIFGTAFQIYGMDWLIWIFYWCVTRKRGEIIVLSTKWTLSKETRETFSFYQL